MDLPFSTLDCLSLADAARTDDAVLCGVGISFNQGNQFKVGHRTWPMLRGIARSTDQCISVLLFP